jgi:predicted DNA-binding transcriptional regulator YafY
LRDAALRGLALVDHRADPVAAAAAEATLRRLAEEDPEGALLCRLYRKLDVRPAGYWRADAAAAQADDLTCLHAAIAACHPVRFDYTDLLDQPSTRSVLPLALVHPPQGVKLVAWCLKAEGYRQFFVREMRGLAPQHGDFTAERLALLQGLVEKEQA